MSLWSRFREWLVKPQVEKGDMFYQESDDGRGMKVSHARPHARTPYIIYRGFGLAFFLMAVINLFLVFLEIYKNRWFGSALISVFGSLMFYMAREKRKINTFDISLLDRIKYTLNLDHAVVAVKKKVSKTGIGGFAIPLLPFYVKLGYAPHLDRREVALHELVHMHYFIYGFQTALLYIALGIVSLYNSTTWLIFSISVILPSFMILQEYLAFTKTREMAPQFGFRSRRFNKYIFTKYVVHYISWGFFIISALFFAFVAIGYSKTGPSIFTVLFILLVLVLAYIIYSKFFYWFVSWFNKRFKDEENNNLYKLD